MTVDECPRSRDRGGHSQGWSLDEMYAEIWGDGGCMNLPPLGYLAALGEVRACLAALADIASKFEESAHFDRLLIELDGITGDVGPACSPRTGTRAELLDRLEAAVDQLVEYGVDRLNLELLVAAADGPVQARGATPLSPLLALTRGGASAARRLQSECLDL